MRTDSDLVLDNSGKRHVVEQVCKLLPWIGRAILSETFIVEAVAVGIQNQTVPLGGAAAAGQLTLV